jgi:hypothetical protein
LNGNWIEALQLDGTRLRSARFARCTVISWRILVSSDSVFRALDRSHAPEDFVLFFIVSDALWEYAAEA